MQDWQDLRKYRTALVRDEDEEMERGRTARDPPIDRVSPKPFYVQLSGLLEEAINRGEYRPGDRIPTESELCRTYNLARSTVRDALRGLLKERTKFVSFPVAVLCS